MDPYIILAKTEQGVWIETKEIGTSQWSLQQSSKIKQEQLILAQGEDSKGEQMIYLTEGSFQVILYKMIRFLSGKLKKHTKLAKIVKISEIFNRLVFPINFNRFCHPMTILLLTVFEKVSINVVDPQISINPEVSSWKTPKCPSNRLSTSKI